MKFKFSYYKVNDKKEVKPVCSSVNSKNEGNISCYLMDIEEDLEKTDYVEYCKELLSRTYIGGRSVESWEGNVIGDKVFICFQYYPENRDLQAEISRKSMSVLLKKWTKFLEREQDLNYEEMVGLPDNENPTVYSEAYFGTYETFLEKFEEGQQYEEDLLYTAFCNYEPKEKYKIVKFLLEKGASVKKKKGDGINLFFPLFSNISLDNRKTDLEITLDLCKILLERGESLSSIDMNTGESPLNRLFCAYRTLYPDEKMTPLYNIVFSEPNLKILFKDKNGNTPLDIARKNGRDMGVKYIEEYIEKNNLTVE